MKFTETKLAGAYLVDLEKREDERGFFARQFCSREFSNHNLPQQFVQVNNSLNINKHTLRGLHYQLGEHTETKLVRCIQGALLDIIIDFRPASPTYRQWIAEELTAENRRMLVVPKGFAHGFFTLTDNTEIFYLVDNFYVANAERGIRWNDPLFGVTLPHPPAVISEKDANWPDFNPKYHHLEQK